MTIIIAVFQAIMFNRITRAIAAVALALLAAFGFVKKSNRDAVKQEQAKVAAQDAYDKIKAREIREDAEDEAIRKSNADLAADNSRGL